MSNKRGKTEYYLHFDGLPSLKDATKDLGPFKVLGKPAIKTDVSPTSEFYEPEGSLMAKWFEGLREMRESATRTKDKWTADIVLKERVTYRVKRGPGRGRLRCHYVVMLHAENAYPVGALTHQQSCITQTFNCTIRKPRPALSRSIDKETGSE